MLTWTPATTVSLFWSPAHRMPLSALTPSRETGKQGQLLALAIDSDAVAPMPVEGGIIPFGNMSANVRTSAPAKIAAPPMEASGACAVLPADAMSIDGVAAGPTRADAGKMFPGCCAALADAACACRAQLLLAR